jgi:hypothetical protein
VDSDPPPDRARACDWTLVAKRNRFSPVGVSNAQSRKRGYDTVQLAVTNFANSAGLCGLGAINNPKLRRIG